MEFSRILFLERAWVLRLRRSEQPTRDLAWWHVAFLHKNGVSVLSIGSSKLNSPAIDTSVYARRALASLQHAGYPGALLFANNSGR